MGLQTITPEHQDLRQISIHVPYSVTLASDGLNVRQIVGEENSGHWLGLDRLLVHLLESRSIRPTIIRTKPGGETNSEHRKDYIGCLFPELTRRGLIDLIE